MNNRTYSRGVEMQICRILYRDGSSSLGLFECLRTEKAEFLKWSAAYDVVPAKLTPEEKRNVVNRMQ